MFKTKTMTKTALQIVESFQQSLGAGTNDWEQLFAEDIVFKGPVDTVKGKTANIELNKNFMPLVKEYKPLNMFEGENFVSLEGIYVVETPSEKTINLNTSEVYEVINNQIKNIRIYYDAEEFRKEFAVNN
jgi:limonene-1,2-epoxide hydrolase